VYIISFAIGIAANGVVFWAILYIKRRTMSEIFVLNLILTDLIYITGLPFWSMKYFTKQWLFGNYICKFCGGSFYTGMFAMSGFVMLLALDRTIIIFGNKKCKELRKNNIAMGLSITVWIISSVGSMPMWIACNAAEMPNVMAASYNSTSNSTSTEIVSNDPALIIDCVPNFNGIEHLFYVFAFTRVIFFLVPMLTVGTTNGFIVMFIMKNLSTKTNFNRNRDIKFKASSVAILIIITFFVTWLPNQVTSIIIYMRAVKLIDGFNSEIFIELHKLTTCLLFVSSSVNPFLYAFYGQRLRALILMKVAKVKHLFYPKKLMSAAGERSSHRCSDRHLFDSHAPNDNTSRISIMTGKTYVVRNSSFEGENTTVSSSPCVPSSVEIDEKEPFPCCQ